MTEPIPILREGPRLKKQALHLVHKQFRDDIKRGWIFFTIMFSFTAASIFIALNYEKYADEDWASGIFLFTGFFWLSAIMFMMKDIVNYFRSLRFTKRSLDYYLENAPQSFLCYDEEKIKYITGEHHTEHPWSSITSFFENNDTIYLIPNDKLLEAFYFAKDDIGPEHYHKIHSIISAKLL